MLCLNDTDLQVEVEEDILDIVPSFLENQRRELSTLQQVTPLGDFTRIRRIGHSMKGVGGMYGFDWISRFGARLEHAAEHQRDQIPAMLELLARYLGSVKYTPVAI